MNDQSIRAVCVYCGSRDGARSVYGDIARELGAALAGEGWRLIYGGGSLGLMGIVACSTLDHGGAVTGIIPDFLKEREKALGRVDELIVTGDMHIRKMTMFERSDGFVILPGGVGTLEELVENLTWAQLGQHTKPIVLVNVEGYWDPLLALFDHMKAEAFVGTRVERLCRVVGSVGEALVALKSAPSSSTPG